MPGIWLRLGTVQLLRLGTDGTYTLDDDGGVLGANPDDRGSYEIDGETITFTRDGAATCAPDDAQAWQAVAIRDVRLHEEHGTFAKVLHTEAGEPDCPAFAAGDQTWLRISP